MKQGEQSVKQIVWKGTCGKYNHIISDMNLNTF